VNANGADSALRIRSEESDNEIGSSLSEDDILKMKGSQIPPIQSCHSWLKESDPAS
jgi:hypothetical protein